MDCRTPTVPKEQRQGCLYTATPVGCHRVLSGFDRMRFRGTLRSLDLRDLPRPSRPPHLFIQAPGPEHSPGTLLPIGRHRRRLQMDPQVQEVQHLLPSGKVPLSQRSNPLASAATLQPNPPVPCLVATAVRTSRCGRSAIVSALRGVLAWAARAAREPSVPQAKRSSRREKIFRQRGQRAAARREAIWPRRVINSRTSGGLGRADSSGNGLEQIGPWGSPPAWPAGSWATCSALRQRASSSVTSQARSSRSANVTKPFGPSPPNRHSKAVPANARNGTPGNRKPPSP
jgi:hypothetical protein